MTGLNFVTRLMFPVRMRVTLMMLLVAMSVMLLSPAVSAQLLDQKIQRPAEAETYLLWATQDLADYLQQMTGQAFSISELGNAAPQPGGIVLAHVNQPGVPQDIRDGMKNKSLNAFHIRMVAAQGSTPAQLWIVGNDLQLGLCHGIYFYLEQLGMRFYGLYRIQIKGEGARKIRFPEGVPMILTSFHSLGRSGNMYFYVPKDVRQIALHMITAGTRPRFYDGAGNQIEYDGRPSRQFMLDVPPGQDGKVWRFNNFKGKDVLTPINLPHAFSMFPDTMLVPQDALKR